MIGGYVYLARYRHLFFFKIVVTCSAGGAGKSKPVNMDPVSVSVSAMTTHIVNVNEKRCFQKEKLCLTPV